MLRRLSLLVPLLTLAASGSAVAQSRPEAGKVRVRITTSDGAFVLALDARHAPKTTARFLQYVDDGRLDGTRFYRAARSRLRPRIGFIQGGIGTDARRILPPPDAHEPTNRTGIRHLDGTISMARRTVNDPAGGNFFVTVGPAPQFDARPGYSGYPAFGRVVEGMATVRRILAEPSGGGSEAMKGQMILHPVRILRAQRIDGTPRPTGAPKTWQLLQRR
ncbi:peptidylprolyl isomerase [Sphingomonas aracearum]|uniref:peptidylprolyl isomerase n=1 Tax=Sphingomonas aracearum TaxID=2283317 RepID=A0A369VZJ6_9SPHN|nr:peptidylprolyl isomerase [Sphingomonas aracearum]RDE06492.1 peptidylprolyl isomerase [Sphingomonas aracearum]